MVILLTSNEVENFKGFLLTLFESQPFISMLKFEDRKKLLDFFIENDYYDKSKLKMLITMYNLETTPYNSLVSIVAKPQIMNAIASQQDKIIDKMKSPEITKEFISFNKMLYSLKFFQDKKISRLIEYINGEQNE